MAMACGQYLSWTDFCFKPGVPKHVKYLDCQLTKLKDTKAKGKEKDLEEVEWNAALGPLLKKHKVQPSETGVGVALHGKGPKDASNVLILTLVDALGKSGSWCILNSFTFYSPGSQCRRIRSPPSGSLICRVARRKVWRHTKQSPEFAARSPSASRHHRRSNASRVTTRPR